MSHKKSFRFLALIISLSVLIGVFSPVAADAAVARSTTLSKIISSEVSTPLSWTVTIDGNTLTAVITDINAPDGFNASIRIIDMSYSVWAKFTGHKAVLSMDISGLSSGVHTLTLFEERAYDHRNWSIADYTITKSGSDIYFYAPAGESEKEFLADINKNYDPLEYDDLPWINSVIYSGTNEDRIKEKLEEEAALKKILDKAEYLCRNASSDEEKVKMIHDWIARNLAYDYEGLYSGDTSNAADPFWVFENKRGVCAGFTGLAKIMFAAVGIPCIYVHGKTNVEAPLKEGVEYTDSSHAWNLVFVNGEWKIVDITWDCQNAYYGKYNGTYGDNKSGLDPLYTYFFISPEVFGFSHISLEVNDGGSKDRIIKYDKGYYCFYNYNRDYKTASYLFPASDIDEAVTIGGEININGEKYRITEISTCAFYGNKTLKEIIVLPGVDTIGVKAFANCRDLRKAVLSGEIRYIKESTFSGCKSLKEIVLPQNLLKIGSKAFFNCSSLAKITVPGIMLNKVANNAFKKAGKQLTIYYPKGKMKKYKKLFKKTNAVFELIDPPET